MSRAGNFALYLKHVPSNANIADAPYRTLSGTISVHYPRRRGPELIQASFGPHMFDLLCLDSNCCRDRDGSLLPDSVFFRNEWFYTTNRDSKAMTLSVSVID